MAKTTTELWSELKAWYAEYLPEALESLNSGASEEAIAVLDEELQREIGQGLPEELRELYAQNDGQDRFTTTCGMFFGLEFSSLSQMLLDWQVWRDAAQEQDMDADFREFSTIYPPETIQNVYACPFWLPFVRDGGGNHLGLDLQPGSAGLKGQVINFGRDEEYRCVVADSLAAFLEWLLAQYRSGNYRIVTDDIDGREVRRIQMANPSVDVFLDALPVLFAPS